MLDCIVSYRTQIVSASAITLWREFAAVKEGLFVAWKKEGTKGGRKEGRQGGWKSELEKCIFWGRKEFGLWKHFKGMLLLPLLTLRQPQCARVHAVKQGFVLVSYLESKPLWELPSYDTSASCYRWKVRKFFAKDSASEHFSNSSPNMNRSRVCSSEGKK